jgi:hypothetical protein
MLGARLGFVVAVVATLAVPASAAGQAAGCGQPYGPVYLDKYLDSNHELHLPPQVEASSVEVSQFLVRTFGPEARDLDGNGTEDIASNAIQKDPSPTVARPAGDISFTRAGATFTLVGAGELDDSAGQEIEVNVVNDADPDAIAESYLVPYGTASGTFDPADVGIEIKPGLVWPIGDWDGDGRTDLVRTHDGTIFEPGGTAPSEVYSGTSLLAVAAPSDATGVEPLETVAGTALALVPFDGLPPVLVTLERSGNTAVIRMLDDGQVLEYHLDVEFLQQTPSFFAVSGVDGRFLLVRYPVNSGPGDYEYWLSLDGPCAALVAAVQETPAATPVEGTPRYTG